MNCSTLRSLVFVAAAAVPVAAAALAVGDGAFFVSQAKLSTVRKFGRRGVIREIDNGRAHVDSLDFVAVDGSARILVAGLSYVGEPLDAAPAVARFLPDGARDVSFGDDGIVVLDLRGFVTGFAMDREGRAVVVGSFLSASGSHEAQVIRLTVDGVPDPEFSGDGVAKLLLPVHSVRLAATSPVDSSVLTSVHDVNLGEGIVRIRDDGSVDGSYGGSGVAVTLPGVNSIAIDSVGRAVVATTSGIERFDASGERDLAFGNSGVLVGPTGDLVFAQTVRVDSEDRIVASGFTSDVFRFLPSGDRDGLFREGGAARMALGVPANSAPVPFSFGIPKDTDGPYAFAAGLFYFNARSGRQTGTGAVLQALDTADPSAVLSIVRRDAKTHGRDTQTFLPAVAVSPDGRFAYAAGTVNERLRTGSLARSSPIVLAVDLTRSSPVRMPSLAVSWNENSPRFSTGDDSRVSGTLRVTNAGRGGVANATVTFFLSEDSRLDSTDERLFDAATGPIPARGSRTLRVEDSPFIVTQSAAQGRRVIAVLNENGLQPELDPDDNVAVSDRLP